MPLKIQKQILVWGWIFSALLLQACSNPKETSQNDYLIKVKDNYIMPAEYNKAFETALAESLPYKTNLDASALKEAKLRLVGQLVDKMLIKERAQELGIEISAAEIEEAVAVIKQDYPDETFKQVLLENAVSYPLWLEGLKERLLMEKVIDRDITAKIIINPEDIETYYIKNYPAPGSASGSASGSAPGSAFGTTLKIPTKDVQGVIIKQLRREKTEQAYNAWIKSLRESFTVDINQQLLEKIIREK